MRRKELAHRLFHNNKYNKNIEIDASYVSEILILDVVVLLFYVMSSSLSDIVRVKMQY